MTIICPICGLPNSNQRLTNQFISELKKSKPAWQGYYQYTLNNMGDSWKSPIQSFNDKTNWLNQTQRKNGYFIHTYCLNLVNSKGLDINIYYSSNDDFNPYRDNNKFNWIKLWENPLLLNLLYYPLISDESRTRINNYLN